MSSGPHLTVSEHIGEQIAGVIPDLARLRIAVFREFPYLYAGNEEYEKEYLRAYLKSDLSYVATAADGDRIVGASTAMPLASEDPSICGPFAARGFAVNDIFYFGESVLLPEYRGCGVGAGFMQRRLSHARQHGFKQAAFCAVIRPQNHPRRPTSYRPLDGFWQRCGFGKVADFTFDFSWQDLDEPSQSPKPMQVWMGNTL